MKKVSFSNAPVLPVPAKTEETQIKTSKSTNGLSSLTRSIIEHETKQNEMNDILENMREVVKKYQDELFLLKEMLKSQNEIIKSQEVCLSEYEQELKACRDEIKKLVAEIKEIWET